MHAAGSYYICRLLIVLDKDCKAATIAATQHRSYPMAGKSKSIYLTIYTKGTLKTVFHKVFFEAKSYNEYVKTDEFKAKWPVEEFDIVKETY
jgi:hypothetical protein